MVACLCLSLPQCLLHFPITLHFGGLPTPTPTKPPWPNSILWRTHLFISLLSFS
jgi:hypothetical protein